MFVLKRNAISAEEFILLYNLVKWGILPIEQAEKALRNSLCVFSVYQKEKIIGVGRLCGDNAMSFYVKDLAVHPDYQNSGVGTLILQDMLKYITEQIPKGWSVSFELISAKGKEGFYQKFGFEKRPSKYDGAGMFMMINV